MFCFITGKEYMSFLKIFFGKTAEDLEQKGDEFTGFELWGKGKLMYERA